ncbi:MAG: septum formation protein Maf [Clostridia bacterium]|nr:septum formation protein Maf [Clostridia bacterium]
MRSLILASASPRRREICTLLGLDFSVCPAMGEAPADPALPIEDAIREVAKGKAEEVAARYPDTPVLGADTAVIIDNDILGKPRNREEAAAMLRRLSGRTHRVITGVWLCDGERSEGFADVAEVTFASLSEEDIATYVATDEPMDKAGAYAIQGIGMRYVKGICGDFYTVMGLPSSRLYTMLKAHL